MSAERNPILDDKLRAEGAMLDMESRGERWKESLEKTPKYVRTTPPLPHPPKGENSSVECADNV